MHSTGENEGNTGIDEISENRISDILIQFKESHPSDEISFPLLDKFATFLMKNFIPKKWPCFETQSINLADEAEENFVRI